MWILGGLRRGLERGTPFLYRRGWLPIEKTAIRKGEFFYNLKYPFFLDNCKKIDHVFWRYNTFLGKGYWMSTRPCGVPVSLCVPLSVSLLFITLFSRRIEYKTSIDFIFTAMKAISLNLWSAIFQHYCNPSFWQIIMFFWSVLKIAFKIKYYKLFSL